MRTASVPNLAVAERMGGERLDTSPNLATMDDRLAALYAPFGLLVTAGDITLRLLRDADLPAYAELISSPLFADETADSVFDWWLKEPELRLLRGQQHLWKSRAGVRPEEWLLSLGVFQGEDLIGVQDLASRCFSTLGVVDSGSYLRLDKQGRGIGRLMRQMILVLAFDHLGAVRAESGAIVGNDSSLAVSRKCGYELDGTAVTTNGDRRVEIQRVVVTPQSFVRPDVEVRVSGLTSALREQLGTRKRGNDGDEGRGSSFDTSSSLR